MQNCLNGLKWESQWVSEKTMWDELPNEQYLEYRDQIERRVNNPNMFKINERGEEKHMHFIRKKLEKGISAEYFVYYILNKLNPGSYKTPRDEGASWRPDLYGFDGSTLEIKCTEGELLPGWRDTIKKLNQRQKQRFYAQNSPSYFFQYGDKDGNKSQRNTDPIFRSHFGEKDYLVLVRRKKIKKEFYFKISGILVKNHVRNNINMYFENMDWHNFTYAKKRLMEDKLMESNIAWIKPNHTHENVSTYQDYVYNPMDFPKLNM